MANPALAGEAFHPHGVCYLWSPPLIWLHVISDFLIFAAYITIPIALVYFVSKRRSVPFPGMFLMFGAFIIACGLTHLMGIWTLWTPSYWLSGSVKFATAIISVVTAIRLRPLLPQALALRTPAELEAANAQLAMEMAERQQAEEALKDANHTLRREIVERQQAEAEREKLNRQLVETSRRVGMADVATNVLHNVGNVLNSVNVSTGLIMSAMRQSRVGNISRISEIVQQHAHDLDDYLKHDAQGQQLPGYLASLGAHLDQEHQSVMQEVNSLSDKIDHIKQIIHTQQTVAKSGGLREPALLQEVIEQALAFTAEGLGRHRIEVFREFDDLPPIMLDKHLILQLLVNLISNAKHALEHTEGPRQITIRLHPAADRDDFLRLQVSDTGMGIQPELLTRIFSQGFTTRQSGHGFGLHSSALAAKVMGGSLSASSPGEGQGATFTLDLPIIPVEAPV